MSAVRYHEHGGPEVSKCKEVETLRPEQNEVLIRIEAHRLLEGRRTQGKLVNLPWQEDRYDLKKER